MRNPSAALDAAVSHLEWAEHVLTQAGAVLPGRGELQADLRAISDAFRADAAMARRVGLRMPNTIVGEAS